MTFALAVRRLLSRKLLLGVGLLIAIAAAIASVSTVSVFPPKISKGSLEYFSGRTQILVDSNSSSIGDLRRDLEPMVARANVFSRFMTTPAALEVIGREAGIPASKIYAEGPYQLGQARFLQEPTAERRGDQLAGREDPYRLRFESDPELPIVTVYAEAPTGGEATRLADGAAAGLADYVTRIQDEQAVPERRRVSIRQLGSTTGAPVTSGAGTKVALFVFLVVFALWCVGILLWERIATSWRQANALEQEFEERDELANDDGLGLFDGDPRQDEFERIR